MSFNLQIQVDSLPREILGHAWVTFSISVMIIIGLLFTSTYFTLIEFGQVHLTSVV